MGENPAEQFPYPEKLDLLKRAVAGLLLVHQAGRKEFRSEAAPELHKGKGALTFSECISSLYEVGGPDMVLASLESGGSVLFEMALEYSKLCGLADPGFEFSENVERFEEELISLLVLFHFSVKEIFEPSAGRTIHLKFSGEGSDKFDLAIMKALLQAGKMIERMKGEGWKTSDWGKETGSAKHKGYVSYEDVMQTAKEVSKRLKSKRDIARAVRKRLLTRQIIMVI